MTLVAADIYNRRTDHGCCYYYEKINFFSRTLEIGEYYVCRLPHICLYTKEKYLIFSGQALLNSLQNFFRLFEYK